jgi:hypothetical protein
MDTAIIDGYGEGDDNEDKWRMRDKYYEIRNLNYFCYVLVRNKGENDEE